MQHGFSLLEVLITLFLVSVGLLGFADAEVNAMRELKLLQQYAFLTQAFSSLNETLHVTDDKQLAIDEWQKQLEVNFPKANVTVTPQLSNITILVQWPKKSKTHRFEVTLYD